MTKIEKYFENQIERSIDTVLLKNIVSHLKDPHGKPVTLISSSHQHSKCNDLEYLTIGVKGEPLYDECIYYITDCKRLCKYSVKN